MLKELNSAITKKPINSKIELKDNLKISYSIAQDFDTAIGIIFESKFWAEEIAYEVKTKKKVIQAKFEFPWRQGPMSINYTDKLEDFTYSIFINTLKITPEKKFIILLKFEEKIDKFRLQEFIEVIKPWYGAGGNSGIVFKGKNDNFNVV